MLLLINTGYDSFEGFSYPEPIYWQQSSDVKIDQRVLNKAASLESQKATKLIATRIGDIHNDGRPDQFRLVETDDSFLVFLHRGYTYFNVWGNCGGGEIMEDGIEDKGQLVGAVAKSKATQRSVSHLELQSRQEGSQKFYQIIVTGAELVSGRKQPVSWRFAQVACPIEPVFDWGRYPRD